MKRYFWLVTVASLLFLFLALFLAKGVSNAADFLKLGFEYDNTPKGSIPAVAISSSLNSQRNPSIYGSTVVWSEKIGGYWQIVMLDLEKKTRQQLTEDAQDHLTPLISRNIVIWLQGKSGMTDQIAGVDLLTGKTLDLPIGKVSTPAIENSKLLAIGANEGTSLLSPVLYFDLKSQTTQVVAKFAGASSLRISGTIAVWRDINKDNGKWFIHGFDFSNNTLLQISNGEGNVDAPDISGSIVVWQDNRRTNDFQNHDVYAYDLKNNREFVVSSRTGDEFEPRIYGDIVVWSDLRGGKSSIFASNIKTKTIFTIVQNDFDNRQPVIYGNTVAWTQWDIPSDIRSRSQIMIGQIANK